MAEEQLLTVEEVAARLAVHPDTIRKWIRHKELRAINLGGRAGYRISATSLSAFLREREEGAQEPARPAEEEVKPKG